MNNQVRAILLYINWRANSQFNFQSKMIPTSLPLCLFAYSQTGSCSITSLPHPKKLLFFPVCYVDDLKVRLARDLFSFTLFHLSIILHIISNLCLTGFCRGQAMLLEFKIMLYLYTVKANTNCSIR